MCSPTSVLAATGFLVALTLVARLGALSPASSSECSVLVSDRSELCWDEVSSARDVAAKERAVGFDKKKKIVVAWWQSGSGFRL